MYIHLSNIPNWVFENSDFLQTLNENKDGSIQYIPFLIKYDEVNNHYFDFSNIFQKTNPYLDLDNYLSIYLDIYTFLDFIHFKIPFYKLIEPKDYNHIIHILKENNELCQHFKKNIKGVQHYAFHLKKYNHHIQLFDYDYRDYDENKFTTDLDEYIKESIELDDYDWLKWFMENVNRLYDYEHILFNFDYSNVSLKTFDLLYNVSKQVYPNMCEYIVIYRKSEIFEKYVNKIKETYNNEPLLKSAFERQKWLRKNDKNHYYYAKEDLTTHMEFVKLMLNHGYGFHFMNEYSKNTYHSNNPLLMKYMYENYKDKIDKNVVDICPVIHQLSLNTNICTYQEKCDILDFFITNYNGVFKMEKLLQIIFRTENKLDNNDKQNYDIQFILKFIESIGQTNNIYSYMLYLYFNYNTGIESYIKNNYDSINERYDISKFTNTFKYVLIYKNVDYVNLYITYKLYSNDSELYDNAYYIKYATYDINIFKTLYKNKIGNIRLHDTIFIDAYQNSNPSVILFMLENKYVPSQTVKNIIARDYQQHIGVNEVEVNGVIQVEKYYNNAEFVNKEKIYKMICL